MQGTFAPQGTIKMKVIKNLPARTLTFFELIRFALPFFGESKEVNLWRLKNIPNFLRGFWKVSIARLLKIPHFYGNVSIRVIRANGDIINYGLASMRVVTDTGVGYIVDAFQNSVELENMKYHGFGTGTTAENANQTALITELTTQYATDNTRPTGTTTEGATANIYRTVGTLSPDASVAITEHGIFSQAANSGGVLLDRSVFSAVNLISGDSLQVTYDGTFSSGS
jgi:hypothetical protein